jgi:hypothetical protein
MSGALVEIHVEIAEPVRRRFQTNRPRRQWLSWKIARPSSIGYVSAWAQT